MSANGATPALGDDLYTRSPGRLGRMIAWASRARNEGPTLATHQAKFVGPDELVQANLGRGVTLDKWETYQAELEERGCEYCILSRQEPLADWQEKTILETARGMIGWAYSRFELPLQLLDGLLCKTFVLPNRLGLDAKVFAKLGDVWERGVICSRTANRPDIKAGLLPRAFRNAAPDDSFDHKWDDGRGRSGWYVKDHTPGWFTPAVTASRRRAARQP